MQGFTRGLFDRLENDIDGPSLLSAERCIQSISRDLEALLNTHSAWTNQQLDAFPELSASVLNYGLMDFAALCITSEVDQRRICQAVRLAIERHEPRLRKVNVALRTNRGAINRIDFVISVEVKGTKGEATQFNAIFRPSVQRYFVESAQKL